VEWSIFPAFAGFLSVRTRGSANPLPQVESETVRIRRTIPKWDTRKRFLLAFANGASIAMKHAGS